LFHQTENTPKIDFKNQNLPYNENRISKAHRSCTYKYMGSYDPTNTIHPH